ncbi:uncharacterized protein LOC119455557 [Dermacentor silvarum]|uniref:uncharacterized protein LOC119455557 n=1 Tax=Dermacentor silvarum TaxID=543639 RepID=UPI002100EC37|nr:uncharacterized protein LOC119455557 [Dermacentor silvarum]
MPPSASEGEDGQWAVASRADAAVVAAAARHFPMTISTAGESSAHLARGTGGTSCCEQTRCPASPSQLTNVFGSPVTYTEGIPEDYLLRIHSVYEQEAPWRAALASIVPEAGVPRDDGAGMRDQDGRRMRRRIDTGTPSNMASGGGPLRKAERGASRGRRTWRPEMSPTAGHVSRQVFSAGSFLHGPFPIERQLRRPTRITTAT